MKKHENRKINKQRLLLKVHRYIGLSSFLIICWLAISGLLLNHTETLKLDEKKVSNPLILDLYNIPSPVFTKGVEIEDNWLFAINDDIYYSDTKLPSVYTPPFTSALSTDEFIFISTKKEFLIFTQQLEYIDSLYPNSDIKKLGLSNNSKVVIDTHSGCLTTDQEFTQLSPCTQSHQTTWQQLKPIPSTLKDRLLQNYQDTTISLERVFLDSHSGRILGILGVYFMDIIAILIIILGLSGFIIWLSRKIKKASRSSRK